MSNSDRTKMLRVDLPVEVWQNLDALALSSGVKIGVYVKRLLIAHAEEVSAPSDTPVPAPERARKPSSLTDDQLNRVKRWLDLTSRTLPETIKTRSQLREWAIAEGFKFD